MTNFEALFDYDFFKTELLQHISSVVDLANLKSTSKKINSKLSYDFCLKIFSNPIVFRRLSFLGRIDIIEKVVIFYLNNEKRTNTSLPFFPNVICSNIVRAASAHGRLEFLKLLKSTLLPKQMFPNFQFEEDDHCGDGLVEATKHGKLDVIQFYFDLFPKENLENSHEFLDRALDIAFQNYEKQDCSILMMLLNEYAKSDLQMQFLLKQINDSKTDDFLGHQFHKEWLFSLTSTTYRKYTSSLVDFFSKVIPKLSECCPETMNSISLFSFARKLPFILPPHFIQSFSELKFSDISTIELRNKFVLSWQQKWFAFTMDFESFKNSVKTVSELLETVDKVEFDPTPKFTCCLFAFVVRRTIDKKQTSTEMVRHCVKILKSEVTTRKLISISTLSFIYKMVESSERKDLLELFIELDEFVHNLPQEQVSLFQNKSTSTRKGFIIPKPLKINSLLDVIVLSGDFDLLRWKVESADPMVVSAVTKQFHVLLIEACIAMDFEMVQYLVSLRPKFPELIEKKQISMAIDAIRRSQKQNQVILSYLDDCLKGKISGWEK